MTALPTAYDLLRKRLQRFTTLLQAVEEGDVKTVHRARVATRRLREVLPVLGLEPETIDKLNRKLRKVTKRLGRVRELDVLAETLQDLDVPGRDSAAAVARLTNRVSGDRVRARSEHLVKDQISKMRRVGNKLERVARSLEARRETEERKSSRRELPGHSSSLRWAIEARIARRAAKLASTISGACTVYLPDRLHKVRIATKKLRYSLELQADLAQVRSTPELKQLRKTQDLLGRLHDLQVLIDRTREEQASLTTPDVNVWRGLDALIGTLEDECRRLHGRYLHGTASLLDICSRLTGQGGVRIPKPKARKQASS